MNVIAVALLFVSLTATAQAPNTLTLKEKADGWKLLFGWHDDRWLAERAG